MQQNNRSGALPLLGWWSEDARFEFTSLRYCINPARFDYFRAILRHASLESATILDVGCGGGFLAVEFARSGFDVFGVDPDETSIEAARRQALQWDLPIDYRIAAGEALPFDEASFDVIACCDVLEHVDSVPRVLREVARLLKPGGIFLFDTINRTWRSYLLLIKMWQDWGLAGLSGDLHAWDKFITPGELKMMSGNCGLAVQDMRGMIAERPAAALWALLRRRVNRLPATEIARIFKMREADDLSVSYMGWALKID